MKHALFVFIVLMAECLPCNAQEKLYPACYSEGWGYIDTMGKAIIPPKFKVATSFSEGLAAVRLNGTYGYVNAKGVLVIPYQYDLALPFQNGIARVFIDGKPFIINKNGKILFQHNYREIGDFGSHSFAIVVDASGKYGVIDKAGKLVVPATFKKIHEFHEVLAVVRGPTPYPGTKERDDPDREEYFQVGVIDSTGKTIVGFDKYKSILDCHNGYLFASVENSFCYGPGEIVIDKKGRQKFIIPKAKYELNLSDGKFHDGLAVVEICKPGYKPREYSPVGEGKYAGAINGDGEIVCSDTLWRILSPFSFNRAFAYVGDNKWILVDKKGKRVSGLFFEGVVFERKDGNQETTCPFEDGVAFVKANHHYCLIDTLGNILQTIPGFSGEFKYRRHGKLLFRFNEFGNSGLVGCYNAENQKKIDLSQFGYINISSFSDKIVPTSHGNTGVYINRMGAIVWKAPPPSSHSHSSLAQDIDYVDVNEYYTSVPAGKLISQLADGSFRPLPNRLQVFLDANQQMSNRFYTGIKLFVANTTMDTVTFISQDRQLNVLLQAKDKKGEWRDIQCMDIPMCGMSFKRAFLPPGMCWELCSPVYEGSFQTKIRAKAERLRNRDWDDREVIYSNEIDGTINPGQLWNRQR